MSFEFFLPDRLRQEKGLDYNYEELDEQANKEILAQIEDFYSKSYDLYKQLLQKGVAKEHARIVLPLSLYTQFYWTLNARALINFLMLRTDRHAQYEIRQYAEAILQIFAEKMPWSYEAYKKYCILKDPDEIDTE